MLFRSENRNERTSPPSFPLSASPYPSWKAPSMRYLPLQDSRLSPEESFCCFSPSRGKRFPSSALPSSFCLPCCPVLLSAHRCSPKARPQCPFSGLSRRHARPLSPSCSPKEGIVPSPQDCCSDSQVPALHRKRRYCPLHSTFLLQKPGKNQDKEEAVRT